MNKKETIEFWKMQISTNDEWAARALVRIYKMQTDSEKNAQTTIEHNGVGFSSFDADVLTGIAQTVLKYNLRRPESKLRMTPKQAALVKKRMPKYASQLYRLVNENRPQVGEFS